MTPGATQKDSPSHLLQEIATVIPKVIFGMTKIISDFAGSIVLVTEPPIE